MTDPVLDWLNALAGWGGAMGLRYTEATGDGVVCTFTIDDRHRQPAGLVHGGVHCGVVETLCSVGAWLHVRDRGQEAVGLENTTSFVRAVREGTLIARAAPVARGRTTQLWEAWIRDERDRLVAQGRVRLQNIAATVPGLVPGGAPSPSGGPEA